MLNLKNGHIQREREPEKNPSTVSAEMVPFPLTREENMDRRRMMLGGDKAFAEFRHINGLNKAVWIEENGRKIVRKSANRDTLPTCLCYLNGEFAGTRWGHEAIAWLYGEED